MVLFEVGIDSHPKMGLYARSSERCNGRAACNNNRSSLQLLQHRNSRLQRRASPTNNGGHPLERVVQSIRIKSALKLRHVLHKIFK